MAINNISYRNTNHYKSNVKKEENAQSTKPNDNKAKSTNINKTDTFVMNEDVKANNPPQLNRANAQHLWVDVGGEKVSTFVTPDGVWMAKGGGIGKEAYERVDLSVETSGISKSTMQELKHMSMILGFMPSGQLSVTPSSYGRSILSERGAKLSDLAGVYNVQELQELLNNGRDMSKLTSKPSLFTSEQLDWLRGRDMFSNSESFQLASLKEILSELTNAYGSVFDIIDKSQQSHTESAFKLIFGNNRNFLASQLINMNFNGDASVAFLEQARIDSEKKIDLFADTFLSNFKELGTEKAFELAWSHLMK